MNIAEPRFDINHVNGNNTVIVGSRCIATITGKNHSHVIRDIRSLLDETKDDPDLDHVKVITDSRGYTTEIQLTADLALALVSGYSGQMRLAMIRAIRQLEPKALPSAAVSLEKFVALATLTSELVETREQLTDQIIALEDQNHLNEHKIGFHDKMVNTESLFSISEVAKSKGIGKNRLLVLMREEKILMTSSKHYNEPYQKHVNAGRFSARFSSYQNKDGSIEIKVEFLMTGKGVFWIHELLTRDYTKAA